MTSEEKIAHLIAALDESPQERARIQAELIAAGDAAINPLIEALQAQKGNRAWMAAQILGELQAPQAVSPLAAALRSPNPLLGGSAVESLRQYQNEDIVPLLLEALPEAHGMVQQNIVVALSDYKDRRAVTTLLDLLETTSFASLRYAVIRALGEIGDQRAVPILQTYRDNSDHHIREWVGVALKQLGENVNPDSQGTGPP